MVSPLRKIKDGKCCTRQEPIESRLLELEGLPDAEQVRQCEIRSHDSAEFVSTECILHLVRSRREHRPTDVTFEKLYGILLKRVLTQLPQPDRIRKNKERAVDVEIREQVLEQFAILMAKDREEYNERLDFFEIRFQLGIAKLRATAIRKAVKHAKRYSHLSGVLESGEMSEREESQLESVDSIDFEKLGDKSYRMRYFAAIDHLPDQLRIVIEMVRQGIPFESNKPNVVSISDTLGKTQKTVREYGKEALRILRTLLAEEQE